MKLLEETLRSIEPADPEFRRRAETRILNFAMPPWALGRLLDLAVDLAGITRSEIPPVARKRIVLMAGDHGIAAEGVCPQPSSITAQVVRNFVRGGGGIGVLTREVGAELTVADFGVDDDLSDLVRAGVLVDCKVARGTANFSRGPAMTREQAVAALENGIRLARELAPATDLFGTGEMGIGNTSPSSAIIAVLSGADVRSVVGPGAGLAASRLDHKAEVIRRGIECNKPDPADGIDLLAKVGGFEIGGIAGLILGAASLRKPVLIDGFISSAGALIAATLSPAARDCMILAHGSAEPGHRIMAATLGKKPLLDLGMRLGEGTGAALAMHLADAAVALLREMDSFEHADVSREGLQ